MLPWPWSAWRRNAPPGWNRCCCHAGGQGGSVQELAEQLLIELQVCKGLWVHGSFQVTQASVEGRLMRSLDAGKTWAVVWRGDSVQDLQFVDRSRGWFRTNDTVYR